MYSVPPMQFAGPPLGTFAKVPQFTPYTSRNSPAPLVQAVKGSLHDSELNKFSKEFSNKTLCEATNGFSSSNILGTGSFGSVYRGVLDDDTCIAVKVIAQPSQSGFEDEVKILSKFRHPNLVMLLGFARRGTERMLVYECLDNGDCEKRLKSIQLSVSFVWQLRLRVLLDACRGIAFLHNSDPIVFHRDIKPSNILVDSNWVGKMADFGLSCELSKTGQISMRVKSSAGTVGYACPTYVQSGVVTEASETYSFGICILEFLTNKPPATKHPLHNQVTFLIDSIQESIAKLVPDPQAHWPDRLVAQLGKLVFECTRKSPSERPRMIAVVKRLKALVLEFTTMHIAKENDAPPKPQVVKENETLCKPLIPLLAIRPTAMRQEPNPSFGYLDCRSLANLGESKLVKLDLTNHVDFIIGRNRQTILFDSILLSDSLRLCVSRDHFAIRRDDNRFLLTNLSGNGTVIEPTRFLEQKNETCEIIDGQVIKLVQTSVAGIQAPFVIMKFHVGDMPLQMEY